ncbi:6540_t:CDS:2 [Funneliformis mosseae]|uniref:6540_t:CDS:1 n=1 Tax=Funneliformis mosseae TaxID=27381 RepID=A0A9N9AF45_FUNMO|nr:6540_t:CDS:2 [Funneliformis mosseae]
MKFYNFIFVCSILSIILLAKSQNQNNFTYVDIPTVNASDSTPVIFDIVNFDNTIVVHIIRPLLPLTEDGFLVDKYLSFRTIYPNGSVVPVDIKLDIQDFNFLILNNEVDGISNPIEIYPIRSNFLLVTYASATNVSDPYSYTDWAMIVDLNGNIYRNISFGSSYVNAGTNKWYPYRAGIFVNFDPDKGFLRITPKTNSTATIWIQYEVTEAGEINYLAQDILYLQDNHSLVNPISTIIPMVDGRYAIVYANSTNSAATLDRPFTSQGGVYMIIIEHAHAIKRNPAVLYQTPLSELIFTDIDCSVTYVGIGQSCIVTGEFTNRTTTNTFYLKIDFLSTGTVINVMPLMSDIQMNPLINQYNIEALPYGGYLLSGIGMNDNDDTIIEGFISNDDIIYRWDLPMPTVTTVLGISKILRNNTYVLAQQGVEQNWTLVTTDLYKFEKEKDHGYENFHIDSTSPIINDTVTALDTDSLTIKYYNEVEFSVGHIKIFQEDGTIRQKIPGINELVNYSVDGNKTTVNIKLLDCTLNQPGSRYYVSIENNFVKSRVYQEPLYGVKDHVWTFTTLPVVEEYSESVSGQVRLTANGTLHFESLNKSQRNDFSKKLSQELADAIPISHDRVTTNERFETDASASQRQILLPIGIEKDESRKQRTVKLAINDLNQLIKNKRTTIIGSGEVSKHLDETYGYEPLSTHFKPGLIGALAALSLLVILFLVAKSQRKDARNTAIFQFAIAINDIIFDWVFIFTKAKNVDLFIPSLVILLVSFFVSLILAFRIIDKELRNNGEQAEKFRAWLNENSKIVNIFTILAGTDIEILTVLDSKIMMFGFDKFNVGFSKETEHRIARYSFINIILEDIPQLVIQRTITILYLY